MNIIEAIFSLVLLMIVVLLALVIDLSQVKRHKKIKQDYLDSFRHDI